MNKKNTFILIILVVFVAFLLNGTLIFMLVQQNLESQTQNFLKAHLDSIISLINLNREEALKNVRSDIKVARLIFYDQYSLKETRDIIKFKARNQITNKETKVAVKKWLLNGVQLQYNYQYVDQIKRMIGGTSTIFQKIDQGFVRISTNVLTKDLSRAVGTYIPNDSEVIKTIMTGQRYYGRAYVVNDWYLTAYEPIWIDGEIKGMLYVGVKEKEFDNLRQTLKSIRIGKSGYIAVLDEAGKAIIHPTHESKDLRNHEVVKRIMAQKSGIFYYSFQNADKIAAVHYYEPFHWYVVITIHRYELIEEFLSALQLFTLLFAVFLSTVIVLILTRIIKSNELFLKTLIETIPIPIFYKNQNQIFQDCNYAFEIFIGKKKQEIIGKHIYSLTNPETASALSKIDESIMRQARPQTYELALFSQQDLTTKHVIVHTAVYPNLRKIKGIIGAVTDVTELKKYQDYLKKVSIQDELTGLYNRHGMNDLQDRIFRQAIRENWEISVMMIDVDFFKKYNDTYGHQNGDICLKKIASVFLDSINRPLDIAIRYGGEEFLIILPHTGSDSAYHIAQRIQKGVLELAIEHRKSPFGIVTISQGIYSGIPSQEDTLTRFIEGADRMLYEGKNSGRNSIFRTDANQFH